MMTTCVHCDIDHAANIACPRCGSPAPITLPGETSKCALTMIDIRVGTRVRYLQDRSFGFIPNTENPGRETYWLDPGIEGEVVRVYAPEPDEPCPGTADDSYTHSEEDCFCCGDRIISGDDGAACVRWIIRGRSDEELERLIREEGRGTIWGVV